MIILEEKHTHRVQRCLRLSSSLSRSKFARFFYYKLTFRFSFIICINRSVTFVLSKKPFVAMFEID